MAYDIVTYGIYIVHAPCASVRSTDIDIYEYQIESTSPYGVSAIDHIGLYMKVPQPRFHTTARISRSVSWIPIPGPVVGLFEFLFMATAMSSAGRYTPTGAGFINPNFPNPQGPHDARIIIYGCVCPIKISRRISPKAKKRKSN